MLHYSTTPDGVQRFLTTCVRSAHPHTPTDYAAELALLDELGLSGDILEIDIEPGEIAALELELLIREIEQLADIPQPIHAEPTVELNQIADLADLDFGEWLLEPAEKAAMEALVLSKIGGVSSTKNEANLHADKAFERCTEEPARVQPSTPSSTATQSPCYRPTLALMTRGAKAHYPSTTLGRSTAPTPKQVALVNKHWGRVLSSIPTLTWRALTDHHAYFLTARHGEANAGLALSLNLSRAIEAKARAHADPLRYLSQRLNTELRAMGLHDLPMALALEISDDDKLHLHGTIIPGECNRDALSRALMKAGGKMDGTDPARQLRLRPIYYGDGWGYYCLADRKKTAQLLPGKRLTMLNQPMTRLIRDGHEATLPPKKTRKPRAVSQPAHGLPAAQPSRDPRRAPLRVRQTRQDSRTRLPQVQRPRLEGGNVVREQRKPLDLAQLVLDHRAHFHRQRPQHRLDPLPQHLRLVIGRTGQDGPLRGGDRVGVQDSTSPNRATYFYGINILSPPTSHVDDESDSRVAKNSARNTSSIAKKSLTEGNFCGDP